MRNTFGLSGVLFLLYCLASVSAGKKELRTIGNKSEWVCSNALRIQCQKGVVLPTWDIINDTKPAQAARAFVYFISMIYLFLGIAIISDRFMAAIEIITSQEKTIKIKDKATGKVKKVTVKIWNDTVSNLTLMALGSSAPEILLSVIEIVGRGFVAGELGPSTIVGSAAFNLFMITAVCVVVLPPGEIRRIEQLRVFVFTATNSVWAYIWLYLILSVISPGVIDVWEGVFTLLYFPFFVYSSYLIDVKGSAFGRLRKKFRKQKKDGHALVPTSDGDALAVTVHNGKGADLERNHNEHDSFDNKDIELLTYESGDDPENYMNEKKRIAMQAYHRARGKHPNVDAATLQHLVEQENLRMQHKSRAFYRIQASHQMTGQGNLLRKREKSFEEEDKKIHEQKMALELQEMNVVARRAGFEGSVVYFHPAEYTVVESCGNVHLNVVRLGENLLDTIYVDYETSDGTANAGSDYTETKGTLVFKAGETSKTIVIPITDDDIFELDEYFYCKLTKVRSEPDRVGKVTSPTAISQPDTATITVLDDDYPGVFTIEQEKYQVMETVGFLTIRIVRLIGARGVIRVPYHTEEGSASGGGEDYEDVVGEVEFQDEETMRTIDIQILDREEYEKNKSFSVVLGEPRIVRMEAAHISNLDSVKNAELRRILEAGRPTLGDHKRCEINIIESTEFKNTIDKMVSRADLATFLKSSSWADQFREAWTVEAGDDGDVGEAEAKPSYFDYVMHYLSLFWKLIFAFVPPTDMLNGYACFFVSLGWIGILTAITGDVASHFGCTVGLPDSVVAISFVAMGTSLPDTFASKVATINDDTADSSIGNVTGSNSVNVFLGIGMAWALAAVYHGIKGGKFEVMPGSLGFSVLVFCVEALICIAVMMYRRFNKNIAGELGGPTKSRYLTSGFLFILWLMYLLLSSLETYCYIEGF